ncbi:MAG: FG-GAP-like repeat-containing protein [Promethearchaeia archaeon]
MNKNNKFIIFSLILIWLLTFTYYPIEINLKRNSNNNNIQNRNDIEVFPATINYTRVPSLELSDHFIKGWRNQLPDVDNDGIPELWSYYNESQLRVYEYESNTWTLKFTYNFSTGICIRGAIDVDADKDGKKEAWFCTSSPPYAYVFECIGNDMYIQNTTLNIGNEPGSPAIGDVDKDGYPEILFRQHDANGRIWENIGDSSYVYRTDIGQWTGAAIVADADNDTNPEFWVTGDYTNWRLSMWEASGNNSYTQKWVYSPGQPYDAPIIVGNIDNDQYFDILYSGGDTFNTKWIECTGDDNFTERYSFTGGSYAVMADTDKDGKPEVIIASRISGSNHEYTRLYIYEWDSGTTFNTVYTSEDLHVGEPYGLLVGDIDQDGNIEILVGTGTYENHILVWRCESNQSLQAPTLYPISPNPDYDGLINLDWNDISGATIYYVYRDTSYISSTSGLSPIASVLASYYTDNITVNGTYYYVIVAGNAAGNSSISNCENVTVMISQTTLSAPILYPISPNPDYDGFIVVNWSSVSGATIYYVYRSTSFITSVSGMTPITSTTLDYYHDNITIGNTYYYVIVAGDGSVNSSISNCENVTVILTPNAPILDPISPNPDYDGLINLDWNDVSGATIYYVYRDTSYISLTSGLSPIASVSVSHYTDNITINGTYYYVIVAGNAAGNSSISNCENVTVMISQTTLSAPILYPISPNPDYDGFIVVNWSSVSGATIYYVYRSTSFITSVSGMTPITSTTLDYYHDNITIGNTYYYVIVAGDGSVNSSISNCENVTVILTPNAPILDPISPNPDYDGLILLEWSDVSGATTYHIYRDTKYINNIDRLTPIATVNTTYWQDTIIISGVYYYVIVAGNSMGTSPISNCENVTVIIPLDAPILDPIFPNPDDDGEIVLNWNDIEGAKIYYIYRDENFINSIDGLTPIAITTHSYYKDNIDSSGTYYYIIIAGNDIVNSTLSNCESVKVELAEENNEEIPPPIELSIEGYNIYLLLNTLIIIAISLIISKRKKI